MRSHVFLRNALFCVPACILLCSCDVRAEPGDSISPKLSGAYEVTAAMDYSDGKSAQFALTRYGAGSWEALFDAPETLSGVMLRLDGNAVTANYKGLAFTVPKSALPAKAMLCLMTDVLDGLDTADPLPCSVQEDGSYALSGDAEGGSYTVTFSDAGELLCFEMPAQPLKVSFSDFAPINVPAETTSQTDTTTETTAETAVTTTAAESESTPQ